MGRSWTVCAFLVQTLISCCSAALQEPSINVALQTSFDAAPYLIELLETAALENSTSYFPLLDRIAAGTFIDLQTERDLYNKFIDVLREDGHFSSPESLSSFKFALALHAAAPRVEAHFQYYKSSVEPKMMAAQDAACPVWVYLDGMQYCSPALERAQQPVDMEGSDIDLPFDRVLGDYSAAVSSILYADITHPLFGQFHETVSQTAIEGKTSYRVRYRPASEGIGHPLFVSGYGAELVLKRTDYIVIDDRDASSTPKEESLVDEAAEKTPDLKPLTTSELSKLGVNAAAYILASSNPMDTLLDVSANFPKLSSQIAAYNESTLFETEHLANRDVLLPPGYNVIWMNGLQIESRQINAYSLIDILRREKRLISQLKDVGLTAKQAVDLLSHEVLASSIATDEPPRYDWRDEEEGESIIIWLNNIEQDQKYAQWPTNLRMLLQRTYPGQLPEVRRDIHNLIVPIDMGRIKDLEMVVNALQNLVKRQVPIRIGLVPSGKSKVAVEGTRLSYYILDTYGIGGLMTFYQNVVGSKQGISDFKAVFEKVIENREPREGKEVLSYTSIIDSAEVASKVEANERYLRRLALYDSLDFIINGVALPRDEVWFDKVSQRVTQDNRNIQMGVYEGTISNEIWVPQLFLSVAALKRNTLIIPNDPKDIDVVGVADVVAEFPGLLETLPRLAGGESSLPSEQAHLLVIADFNSAQGQAILKAALAFYGRHPEADVLFLHNSESDDDPQEISTHIFSAGEGETRSMSAETLLEIVDGENLREFSDRMKNEATGYWISVWPLIEGLGIIRGRSSLWLNGRVVDLLDSEFDAEDFETLLDFERKNRIAPVTTAITGLGLEDKFQNPLDLAKVTSIVARSLKSDVPEGITETPPPIRINRFKQWTTEHTMIHASSPEEPTIQIVAAVDPASEVAQPWIPILKVLSELEGVDVQIHLNPKNKLEELPVKRFYSQVISSSPSFNDDGSLVRPQASFDGIPKETLFNLGMVLPPAWLVAPKHSVYDLDNIKLSSVPVGENVEAIYELEHILIDGHSRDTADASPPRGVQLILGTQQNPHVTDTIVMSNLGYFQFKSNPGFWQISLKSGQSSRIFSLDSVGARGYTAQPGDETTAVALLSFQGTTLYPRLSRRPGMEEEDVLETSVAGSARDYLGKGASFASSALSSLGLKKSKSVQNADINIFSVASGHLYERMLNIMMVSVMRHTKHSVKFWFIEQFLSPSFKASLPSLASHYKFEYEMVTYKWPHWLRGQKEKQREIWGYKILFLDVLFPLDLDKVIFVDADQIVRTDMMELNKVDLHGAPYGFTPMCDSRTEMEGFRFWKQGYWKNYLAGKPYHISALYVVDLKKFRQLAAGDRLRQQYHALSSDPASLSNLDQDLPNHMQHNLPIHSLSQEWLWCETWCSDESLSQAKTIDLCNNPLTREPKLERARRQVPEWNEYDEEIARVLARAKQNVTAGAAERGHGVGFDDVSEAAAAEKQKKIGIPPVQGDEHLRKIDEL